MEFKVPKFIEVEDKIFGPFTFKQFIYLAGGAGAVYVLYKVLPLYVAIFLIPPVAALALALALYKINNKPFIFILQASIRYFFQSKLYIWKKSKPIPNKDALLKKAIEEKESIEKVKTGYIPKLSESKLKDLSWSLDVLDVEKNQEQS